MKILNKYGNVLFYLIKGENKMSKTKLWKNITLEDVLRVDSFDQQLYIHDPVAGISKPMIQDNREFFTQIYSDVSNNEIEFNDGSQNNKRKTSINEWLSNEISKTENSLVIFFEGYAGCGKSTFVQYLLTQQLKTYNYDYNYYNYDIGAYYDNKKSHRIITSIRECFIQQLIKCIINNKIPIIKKFQNLLSDYSIRYLDTSMDIYNEFVNTSAFNDAISNLQKNHDKNSFRLTMHTQLKYFSCEQILALDYILRLSKYIVSENHDNPLLFVCYDNMDSIENFDELNNFDNTLISLRKNIDDYINNTGNNYIRIPKPHFIIMATYRKITASKVELFSYSERMDDHSEYNQYIQYMDISHVYSFYNIIHRRKKYFSEYIIRRKLDGKELLDKLSIVNRLTKTEFVHNRYAGLWNNNYRTCSSILNRILSKYQQDAQKCVDFINSNIDGYDEENSAYFGASAIFLSLVCKIFNEGGLWESEHMNLIPLNIQNKNKPVSELTSLSRLILTYISNITDSYGRTQPVSMPEIFNEFSSLYDPHDICKCLANMLVRDKTDTWRRPIYYHRNAINDNENIEQALYNQWVIYNSDKNSSKTNYTELLLCECGFAYIERLTSEFEFFSNRISNNNQSIYFLSNINEISNIIDKIYEAVKNCCQDMIKFSKKYMEKKNMSSYKQYIKLPIHPRTYSGNPQLHTERIIFSHIHYLNHCRIYHINRTNMPAEKKTLNTIFINYISKYLNLYLEYIQPINTDRIKVAKDLLEIIQKIETGEEDSVLYQSISSAKHS